MKNIKRFYGADIPKMVKNVNNNILFTVNYFVTVKPVYF